MRIRFLSAFLLVVGLPACAGRDYKDNAAEIARDPRCMDKPSIPDAEPAPWCKQKIDSRSSPSTSDEVDFSGKKGKKAKPE